MEFTLVEQKIKGWKFKTETLHIEQWLKDDVSVNHLDNIIDGFWDGDGDIVRDASGKLYCAERFWRNTHEGEYGIWCEITE